MASSLHTVEWTPDKVSRFWNWRPDGLPERAFFAQQYSVPMVKFARAAAGLSPPALVADVGAGGGDLLDTLLDEGFDCVGFEVSNEATSEIERRLRGRKGFRGARTGTGDALPAGDGEFDVCFALEVVEHLLDEQVDGFFSEAARVLRPGGRLVLSTPNAERLQAAHVLCPDCGSVFHPVQHVQSWNADGLEAAVRAAGFDSVTTRTTRLFTSRLEALLSGSAHVIKRGLGVRKEPLRPNLLLACRTPEDSRP